MGEKYMELDFHHFIVARSDGTIFGSARYNGDGRVHNFLIKPSAVLAQYGNQWKELGGDLASIIRQRAKSYYGHVPIYRTNRLLFN
ncbi:hypothetical protein ACFL38_05045 [Candidatus Omnitrophota bacterium]